MKTTVQHLGVRLLTASRDPKQTGASVAIPSLIGRRLLYNISRRQRSRTTDSPSQLPTMLNFCYSQVCQAEFLAPRNNTCRRQNNHTTTLFDVGSLRLLCGLVPGLSAIWIANMALEAARIFHLLTNALQPVNHEGTQSWINKRPGDSE